MKNTTLCYLKRNNKYLLMHRIKKENDLNHDKWVGVGGKFLENESPEECLKREVLEETGLKLKEYRYCGIVTFVSDEWEGEYMHLYIGTDWEDGAIKECDEGVLEWVGIEKVESLPIWEGDKIFLNLIKNENQPFFSLKLEYLGDRLKSAILNGETKLI